MTRADQQEVRRERQAWCPARYTGEFRMFDNARCKLPEGHEGDHRTWRHGDGVLFLQWSTEYARSISDAQ